ncbi:MAG: glycosyltransferase [Lysinibacillus sp.]
MSLNDIFIYIHTFFGQFITFYMVLVILVYTGMLLFAVNHFRKGMKIDKYVVDEGNLDMLYSKPVSIIVPAYNEEAGIVGTVSSLLSLQYPQFEIIIVNDGSNDGTKSTLIEHFKMEKISRSIRAVLQTEPIEDIYESTMHPNITLINKVNGGKADALNVGINVSNFPYFCSIDGDSILETTSLLRVMEPIISSNDEVIAAGGSVRIANNFDIQRGSIINTAISSNPFVIMQIIEYIRAFFMGRIALSKHNLVLIISGAFSVFSKKWVIAAGGYSVKTVGEDMELVVRLHRYVKEKELNKKIQFIPDPVCWTEAPENMPDLRKQRRRWHQGLIGSLWMHKRMTFNPKYGKIGMISFPYFWFIEFFGPLIELGGYIYILISFMVGNLFLHSAIIMTALFVLYGVLLSVCSILLEAWGLNSYPRVKDVVKLLLYSLTETFWYRPLTILFRLEGIWYFITKQNNWGQLERRGLSKKYEANSKNV